MGFFSGINGIGEFLKLFTKIFVKLWGKYESKQTQEQYDRVSDDPAAEWMRRFDRTKDKKSNS